MGLRLLRVPVGPLDPPLSTRLTLVAATATPICAYSLLWNLSVVRYYSMLSDPAQLAGVIAPGARVLEHLLLWPCLMALYFLASGPRATRGILPVVLAKQLALLSTFGLLVRPALYLGLHLTGTRPQDHTTFLEFLDLDSVVSTFFNYSMTYALGVFLLFGLLIFDKYREGQLHVAQLNASLLSARLEALRQQLHPHFLFNTLNTISSLVTSRPETARELIVALATLLRDSIEEGHREFHPLGRECDLCATYLRIVEVRFRPRLQYDLPDPGGLRSQPVPHGILLTLLENAATHGVAAVDRPCRISVAFATEDGAVTLQVRNTCNPRVSPDRDRRGGLGTLQVRLETLYGSAASLSFGREHDLWTATVSFPAALPDHAGSEWQHEEEVMEHQSP
jgi:hypothetical protein